MVGSGGVLGGTGFLLLGSGTFSAGSHIAE